MLVRWFAYRSKHSLAPMNFGGVPSQENIIQTFAGIIQKPANCKM